MLKVGVPYAEAWRHLSSVEQFEQVNSQARFFEYAEG